MIPSLQADRGPQPGAHIWRTVVFVLVLLTYFAYFTWEGLHAPFAADDMMNLAEHWRHNPWRLVYAPFQLWHDYYRPMGAFFYVPIFTAFGLNPLPYHAVLLMLVLLYVGLVYGVARVLGATALEAWLAALLVAYHAGLANLYYETSHIYDVLCGVFYAAALICYLRPRSEGRAPRGGEAAAFFALFLCALNSKEMAVTLPAMLLASEWLYGRGPRHGAFRAWMRESGWIIAGAGLMTAVAIYGRVLGGLVRARGYAADYSAARFAEFQRQQFQDLFFQWKYEGWILIVVVWALATYLAWRTPRPAPRFCWVFMVLAPLPVEFLEGRSMAVLAVPLLGWAILAGIVGLGLMRAIANAIARDPGFRRLPAEMRLGLVMGAFLVCWAVWNRGIYDRDVRWAMWDAGRTTTEVIRQFEVLQPRVRPHSTVVFLNDPFDGWDMAFIAELWFHDRTVEVRLQKKTPLTAAQLARADYVFDWRGGRLVQAGGSATASESRRP